MARGKHDKKKRIKVSDVLIDIVLLGLVVLMVFSGIEVYKIAMKYQHGRETYADLQETAGLKKERDTKKESSEEPLEEEEEPQINWEALKATNEDIIGWITMDGTPINYPVLRGDNNDEYLYATPTGEYSICGSIFVDCNTQDPFTDDLTILYGHRMKDGSMFATIKYYFLEEFFKEHPTMMLYTPDKTYEVEFFSCKEVYGGDENVYKYNFYEGDKAAYIENAMSGNEMIGYDGRVNVSEDDRLIMMSTCTVNLDDNRLVLWGRLIEKETIDE